MFQRRTMIDFLALVLVTLYIGTACGGAALVWKLRGRRRWLGVPLSALGLAAVGLLGLMSSKYWFGDSTFFTAFINLEVTNLATSTALTVLALGLGAGAVFGVGRVALWLLRGPRPWLGLLAPVLLLAAVGAAGTVALVALSSKDPPPTVEAAQRQIQPAPGFSVALYANGPISSPTSMAIGPDGRLYVCDLHGNVWVIVESSAGVAEPQLFADGFHEPIGLAWRGNDLYVASLGTISVLRDQNGDLRSDDRRDIVTGLPVRLYPLHQNNGLAFGPDGRLYFGLGSTHNQEPEEDSITASILSVKPDGSDLQVVARGIRNAYDIAFNRAGDLFATENQPAGMPVTPGEELNQIVLGGNYGYPYYFEQPPANSGTIGPVYVFPPHSSPDGICFYQGRQFPHEYDDNAFVASWMRGEIYRVQLTKMASGEYASRVSIFASGFVNPLDVTEGRDGSLFVADFGTGGIYRISHDTANTAQR
jgi:putative membrane-bound dehydrogenase-like protein